MKVLNKAIKAFILAFVFLFLAISNSFANNLNITNVSLAQRNPSADTLVVKFNVSWENSWKTKINHDAVWLTVRLNNPAVVPTDKKLCQVSVSGVNPTGSSVGSNSALEIYIPADKKGAFLRPVNYGVFSSTASTDVQLTIDYSTCGFQDSDNALASVFGVEMVYIPKGSFFAGDFDTSAASFDEGSADSDPWNILSEAAISVANPASNGYRYVSNGNAGEDATGTSFTLGESFPKGYQSFYAMKYPVTEGQWVDFINSLPSAARSSHDLTDSSHKNTDSVLYRNTISCSGSPLVCSTQRSSRALSYLSWVDVSAYLDWSALRPMTELEFEKMARGSVLPVSGEFSWGSVDIVPAVTISESSEDGSETISDLGANANFNNTTFSGGDTAGGAEYQNGPLRVGIFAKASSTRVSAGAGYYGVMELSGNLREPVVTVGNLSGRNFQGTNGDGILTTASGSEGYATNSDWPGIDVVVSHGVTGSLGSGVRGGSWDDQLSGARLRISDRFDAAKSASLAENNLGGRGVRTYDGN